MIVQFGGQTPLKLALELERAGVPIIGTTPDSIDIAEDRERFQKLLHELRLKQPPNRTARTEEAALQLAHEIGYPLVVRPSYVLGGRAMEIVHGDNDLRALHARGGAREREVAGAARSISSTTRSRSTSTRVCDGSDGDDRRHHGARRAGRRCTPATRRVRCRRIRCLRSCRTSCAARPR